VFVPFRDCSEYRVLERLTAKQLEEIENELQLGKDASAEAAKAAQRRQEAAAAEGQQQEPPPAEEPAAEVPPIGDTPPAPAPESKQKRGAKKASSEGEAAGTGAAPAPGMLSAEQKELFALLQAYPPAAGWNKAKRDEIARRRAVIGANPSEKEQRFVEVFDQWARACLQFGVAAEPAKQEGESGGEAEEGRRGRKKS
jgi:hypothetical protein